ncbi:MAG: prepilin-type N-terminal cleavage/methylation domain-containing protein [bacterium]
MKNNRGFTLVEVLIYVALSAILVAVSAVSLKSILDYQEVIVKKGYLYENSGRFFANFALDTRNATGFQILDSGHRVHILGTPTIDYFREGERLKKQVGADEAYFITDAHTVVTGITFSVAAGVVKVDVNFNSGEYTPTGYYWARN